MTDSFLTLSIDLHGVTIPFQVVTFTRESRDGGPMVTLDQPKFMAQYSIPGPDGVPCRYVFASGNALDFLATLNRLQWTEDGAVVAHHYREKMGLPR